MSNTTAILGTIFLRGLALLLVSIKVLPKQYKESKIGNGIGFLRKVILVMVITYLLNTLGLIVGSVLMLSGLGSKFLTYLPFLNAFGDLLTAFLLYMIYNKRILTAKEK